MSEQPASNSPAVSIEGLWHSFRNHRALGGVSFEVQRQSLHGFVGPNGAGKTTTLKIICTLLKPQQGNVRVFGLDVVRDVREVRKRIGFMPDHFSMYRQMTVYEYLDFFAAAYGLGLKQRTQVVGDVLSLTDMDGRRDDLINGLSRGMQQRVGLARVLVNDPDLLLLDEPASGLDPRARIELMEILQELRRMGKTIFISSHILSELAELCDSVTIIDRGQVKFTGPMHRLLERDDEHPRYRLELGGRLPDDIEAQLQALPGVIEATRTNGRPEFQIAFDWTLTDANSLLRNVMDLGPTIITFAQEKKHLNQAFMDLTERGVR
ncbi:MAG TPA: ABC transporter ATP-binding protein [Planctomycetaceae bacterium]|nr:ABC transporter ATP-binding protein [Planctomycetaceae bacterium]